MCVFFFFFCYPGNRHDCDDVSEESYSSAHSDEHAIVTNSLPMLNNSLHTPMRNARRTPRQSSTPRQNHDMLDTSRNRSVSIQRTSLTFIPNALALHSTFGFSLLLFQEARPSPERLDAQIRQLVHSIESLKEQNREQHRAMISKMDELIKISARKESGGSQRSSRSQPAQQPPLPQVNHNYEEDLYGMYGEEDYR